MVSRLTEKIFFKVPRFSLTVFRSVCFADLFINLYSLFWCIFKKGAKCLKSWSKKTVSNYTFMAKLIF